MILLLLKGVELKLERVEEKKTDYWEK